jgi:hypothetical protein
MTYQGCRRLEVLLYMAEQQRKAPDRPAAERYYAEHVSLAAAEESAEIALQAAVNEKANRSWTLVSMTKEPNGNGLLLVWDTSGFFSG